MKKIFVLLLVGFVANSAYGAVDYIEVCDSLNIQFSSDREDCYTKVRGTRYIEEQAVSICRSLSFSDDKVECIVNTLNKTYLESEIRSCSRVPFSDEKIECMSRRGVYVTPPPTQPNPNNRLRRQLREVKRLIRRGDYFRAVVLLDRILSNLD